MSFLLKWLSTQVFLFSNFWHFKLAFSVVLWKGNLKFREFFPDKVSFVWDLIDLVSDVPRHLSTKRTQWLEYQLYRGLFAFCNRTFSIISLLVVCDLKIWWKCFRFTEGLFIWGALALLGGLAHLGEMIFITRSYGIFYLSSIKKFVVSLDKNCLIKHFLQ